MQPRKIALFCLVALIAVVMFVLAGPAFSACRCGLGSRLGSRLAARFGRHHVEATQVTQPAEPPAVVVDMGPGYEVRPCASSPTGYGWFKIEIDFGPRPQPKPEPEPVPPPKPQPKPEPDKHPWWPLFGTQAPQGQPRQCGPSGCPCR